MTDDDVTARFGPGETIAHRVGGLGRHDLHAFLDRAKDFTARAAANEHGIAYLIG